MRFFHENKTLPLASLPLGCARHGARRGRREARWAVENLRHAHTRRFARTRRVACRRESRCLWRPAIGHGESDGIFPCGKNLRSLVARRSRWRVVHSQGRRFRQPAPHRRRAGGVSRKIRRRSALGRVDDRLAPRPRLQRPRRVVRHRAPRGGPGAARLHVHLEFHERLRPAARRHVSTARAHGLPEGLYFRLRSRIRKILRRARKAACRDKGRPAPARPFFRQRTALQTRGARKLSLIARVRPRPRRRGEIPP